MAAKKARGERSDVQVSVINDQAMRGRNDGYKHTVEDFGGGGGGGGGGELVF